VAGEEVNRQAIETNFPSHREKCVCVADSLPVIESIGTIAATLDAPPGAVLRSADMNGRSLISLAILLSGTPFA